MLSTCRQYNSALQDLTIALTLAPDNRELRRLLVRVKEECREASKLENGGVSLDSLSMNSTASAAGVGPTVASAGSPTAISILSPADDDDNKLTSEPSLPPPGKRKEETTLWLKSFSMHCVLHSFLQWRERVGSARKTGRGGWYWQFEASQLSRWNDESSVGLHDDQRPFSFCDLVDPIDNVVNIIYHT